MMQIKRIDDCPDGRCGECPGCVYEAQTADEGPPPSPRRWPAWLGCGFLAVVLAVFVGGLAGVVVRVYRAITGGA